MPERADSPAEYGSKGDVSVDIGVQAATQDRDQESLVRGFWSEFERQKSYKYSQVNPRDWRRFALIYSDQQWDGTYQDWQSTPTINLTFAAVNAILPIITDNRPQIAVVPREPDDAKIADVIRAIVEWLWEENNCDSKLPSTMLNTLIFGNGFWKIVWDPTARGGLGDIRILNIDPSSLFVNPEATSFDREDGCEAVYHVEQMSIDRIFQLWPDKAAFVRAGIKDAAILIDRPHLPQRSMGSMGTVDVRATDGSSVTSYAGGSTRRDIERNRHSATVGERWRIDRETGRWRKTVVANNVLLEDEITDLDMVPFVHFVDYQVGWTLWGTGEVQHVESLQYEINRRRGMIADILRFCSLPMLVVDPASGIDHETLKAMPGITIPAEGGTSSVGWLMPQMDLSGLFAVNDRDKRDFNDILGNVDIILGKAPPGVEAGIALEALSEAANTRLRLKVRLMESSLRRAGKLLVKAIQRHYTTRRIFRIVGREFSESGAPQPGGQEQFFSINQPTGVDAEGNPVLENGIPEDAEFDIKIGAGSTLPVSRSARFQQAITLFDRQIVDAEEVLKHAAWPRWEEVNARMQAAQQAQAAMAAGEQGPEPQFPESVEEMTEPEPAEEGGMET